MTRTMTTENQNGGERVAEAAEAAHEAARSVVDKASHTAHGLAQAGERWAKSAEERTLEMGRGLAGQGGRAVDGVSRQVGQNPLASVAIAFGVGFLCAALIRR